MDFNKSIVRAIFNGKLLKTTIENQVVRVRFDKFYQT